MPLLTAQKPLAVTLVFWLFFWQQATRDLQRVSHPEEKERQKRDELYGLAVSQAESRTK